MRTRKIMSLLLCLAAIGAISGTPISAHAAEGATTTNLPGGFIIADQDGVHADGEGYYYIDARGLKPGDVIRKSITIQNLAQSDASAEGKLPVVLSMTAEPLEDTVSGPIDLLKEAELLLELDGTRIYIGPCRGDGTPNMITAALPLGSYSIGDRHTLDVTITVSPSIVLSNEKSEADFRWRFYAVRNEESKPPVTGVEGFLEKYGALVPLCVVTLMFLILLPLKRRRDQRLGSQYNQIINFDYKNY